jgi:hypothetical protein
MPRRALLTATVVATLAGTGARQAVGAARPEAPPSDTISVDVVGACPEETAVRELLTPLVSAEEARSAKVAVQDQGQRFRIAVGETATTLEDAARDCGARARLAATVAAAALQARQVVLGPPIWTVEKGGVLDMAPSASASRAPGLEIRGAYGAGSWSVFGAAGGRGPVTLTLDNGWKADLLRFPLDAGVRLTGHRWRWRPWVGFGGTLEVSGILGQGLEHSEREWRASLGVIAMVGLTIPVVARLGVSAAFAVRWSPYPYRLQVVPEGTVGELPSLWLGPSLSYTLDGKRSSP